MQCPKTILEMLRSSAEVRPQAVALRSTDGKTLTYQQLLRRVDSFRAQLQAEDVKPADRVAIVLPNGIDAAIAFLGVASTATAAPLNPVYRPNEFEFYLDDLRPKALIVADRNHPVVPLAAARHIAIVSDPIDAQVAAPDRDLPQPDDVALILHTSGTTSRPKIVPLSQANLCASARNISDWLKLAPDDCCLNIMPLFHIHGLIAALMSSLRAGGSVVCSPGFISTEFFAWLEQYRPTWYTAVPTMHQAILARPEAANFDRAQSRLRFIRSSSAPLPPVVAEGLEARFGAPVIEAYGMTEASHQMCSNPLPPAERKFGSVGLPAGPEVAILNERGELLTRGQSGEVVIRGENVTRGYEANPQANADAITNGWFRTGDIGRFDDDGYLHLSGRIKEIINRGGEKISPREVDELLLQHPAVAEALTFAVPDPRVGEEVAAVVVLRPDAQATEAELTTFAAEKLAEFKVPRRILIRDTIPKGPTGKPQRIGLAQRLGLNGEEPKRQLAHLEPSTETEKTVAAIWRAVLKLSSISTNDRFFDIGGDSILAAQVVARVQQQVGRSIPIVLVFQSPTIAEMARAIDANPTDRESTPTPLTNAQAVPASFAQRRLWFLDQLQPHLIVYNNAHAIHLTGRLTTEHVRDALQQIVDRHDALRSRFSHRDGVPIIHVDESMRVDLPVVGLTTFSGDRDAEVRRLCVDIAHKPFDLSTAPLARFCLLKLSDTVHVLVYVVHHIISDRWSLRLFVGELLQSLGGEANVQPSSIRYLDYAAEQNKDAAGLAVHTDFWRKELSPLPAPFELNADHARPAVQSTRGAVHRIRLPHELTQSLAAIARSRGATLFTVMLAAFEAFLFRYTGQEDAILGTTIAGRKRVEFESVIGLFVNVLPLRSRIRAEMSFREVVDAARNTMLGVIAHQDLPFDALVDAVRAPRDPSRSPLFQVLFNYHNVPSSPTRVDGIGATVEDIDLGTSRFDLTLTITPGQDEFTAAFEYCSDLFEPATIERMSGNFLTLLESIAHAPESAVGALSILSQRQRSQILVEWNRHVIDAPPDRAVHEMFEDQSRRTPDATALIVGNERVTYAELNRRVNQLAHHLRAMGVGPESRVGICLARTSHLIVAILGVLKSGGAYVPLDPEYPAQRLAFMLEDSKAAVLVTQESLIESLKFDGKAVCIERDSAAIARQPVDDPPRVSKPNHLAYVIYTSGSTGRPKGVAIEHRAPASLVRWAKGYFSDREMRAMLGVASVCFDLSVFEIFLSLTRGGALIFATGALQLADCPAADEATFAFLVPSVFAEMLHANMVPRNLIGIGLGGEAVPEALARRAHELPGVEAVYNLYGPTEDTVISVGHRIGRDETGPPPIGKSIGGGRAYVLNADQQPVPIGALGELYLGGIKVARGYLDRPRLTAERFVTDPFGPPGSRLYRTGDLCRFRHDGNIQFISRIDHQIKIRGFRVELGEVESVLSQHSSVKQCCAATDGEGADRRLIAYLTTKNGQPTVHELRRHMAALVPAHMIPSSFVYLETMPLNASGKVDRAAIAKLRAPSDPQRGTELSTPLQKQIAAIWCGVLGIDRVALHDNFFEIGGHSLRAVSVVARMRKTLGVSVPLREIFEHPTIAELSECVESHPTSHQPMLPAGETERDDQLSPAQRTLWFEQQHAGESGIYNVTVARRLFGPLDPSRLESALNQVIRRHEMLRTCFPDEDGAPRTHTAPPNGLHLSLPVIDCRAMPPDAREAELARIVRVESQTPFDLERLPLLRAKLVQLEDQQFVLVLVIHHIVIDDWSIRILLDEISHFYAGANALPALSGRQSDSFGSFRTWMKSDDAGRQLEYWKSQLAGAPTLVKLPTDRPRPTMKSFRGARERVRLPAKAIEKLHELAKSERATAFMALLAAFDVLLMQWSGETDLVVASPSANRQRPEVQGQIGYFLNMLPLRVKLSRDATFREVLRQVRRVTIEAFDHQELPFETIIERLRPQRSASYTPWAQIMFVHLTEGLPALRLPNIRSEPVLTPGTGAKCDLGVLLDDARNGVEGWMEYNTDLFDAATIQNLSRRFEALVQALVDHPDLPVSALQNETLTARPTVAIKSPVIERLPDRPATETEQKLIRIWRDVLRVDHIGINDDFFELGGNSFLIIRALSRIQKQFGRKLPIGNLFDASTIAKLGALIDGGGDGSHAEIDSEHVMPLQPKGKGAALFLVPGAEGHALIFRQLADLLGDERPIYGLQFSHVSSLPDVAPNMRDLAARTIEHMRRVQPRGPYLLMGYSFGGTLAYEMAHQLVAAGEQVDLVALFDSFPPGVVRTKSPLRRLPVHIGHLLQNGPGGARRHLSLVAQRLHQRASRLFGRPQKTAPHPADELRAACRAAYQAYRPPKYPGDVVLFCAIQRDRWMDFSVADYLNGWSGLVGGEITVYNVSATHSTIFDPENLNELAQQIKQCLQRRATR